MPSAPVGWSEIWRVLAYTVALALAFIVLGRLESGAFSLLGVDELMARSEAGSASADAALARDAEQVALASREALARVPGRRGVAFRLGYELGYASTLIGAFSNSAPEVQAKIRLLGERHLARAQALADALGLGRVGLLPATTVSAYVALDDRFEADENGLGAEVEGRLSSLHRELYVLGALVGGASADVESSSGRNSQPPAAKIRRHATLAGVDRTLWLPLALKPRERTPEQVLGDHRGALDALVAELVRLDASTGAQAATR